MNTKVGRNDPCPCGSGKKYKSCCWGKETKKTYTPSGKRKFKATLLSSPDTRSSGVFQGASPQAPADMPSFDSLKVRFTKSDFRVKSEEVQESAPPFSIPSPEATESIPNPEGFQEPPSLPEGEFRSTEKDFRVKKEKDKE